MRRPRSHLRTGFLVSISWNAVTQRSLVNLRQITSGKRHVTMSCSISRSAQDLEGPLLCVCVFFFLLGPLLNTSLPQHLEMSCRVLGA